MKWKIVIEIEGEQPPADLIQRAKGAAENGALELIYPYAQFVNSTTMKVEDQPTHK